MRRYLTIIDYVDYGDKPGMEYYSQIPVFGEIEVLANTDQTAFFIASIFYRTFELAEVTGEEGIQSVIRFLNLSSGQADFNMN